MRKLLALFLVSSFVQTAEQPQLVLLSSSSEESASGSEADEDSIVNNLVFNAFAHNTVNSFAPVAKEVDVPELPCALEYDSRKRSLSADNELQFQFDEVELNGS